MGYAARTSHLSRRRGRFYRGRVTPAEVGERRDAHAFLSGCFDWRTRRSRQNSGS
jgi:hypothetical protein